MADSETYGIEKGHGEEAIKWMNEQAQKNKSKFEARLYGHEITTESFGSFEMFSWMGDVKVARNLVAKASKRYKIRVIEGGYKTKETIIKTKKSDYAMVRKGDKVIGHLEFSASRFSREKWQVIAEERR